MPLLRSKEKQRVTASLIYAIDWTKFLAGLTITGSEWDIEALDGATTALQFSNKALASPSTKVLLYGGQAGKSYRVWNTITISGNPVQVESDYFDIFIM